MSIGQLYLMLISFKIKFNIVLESITHLGKSLIIVGLPTLGVRCYAEMGIRAKWLVYAL